MTSITPSTNPIMPAERKARSPRGGKEMRTGECKRNSRLNDEVKQAEQAENDVDDADNEHAFLRGGRGSHENKHARCTSQCVLHAQYQRRSCSSNSLTSVIVQCASSRSENEHARCHLPAVVYGELCPQRLDTRNSLGAARTKDQSDHTRGCVGRS